MVLSSMGITGADLDEDTSIGILDALFGGVYKADGGGFGSVAKLWEYLLEEKQDFPPAAHLLAGQGDECSFEGRTPTYESFQETIMDGEQVLRVEFEPEDGRYIRVYYRRAEPGVRRHEEEESGEFEEDLQGQRPGRSGYPRDPRFA